MVLAMVTAMLAVSVLPNIPSARRETTTIAAYSIATIFAVGVAVGMYLFCCRRSLGMFVAKGVEGENGSGRSG